MADCVFCKIVAGEIPSHTVYSDDDILAFHDINPAAPTHILVIPKQHLESLDAAREEHQALLGKMLLVVQRLARELKLSAGYRVVINTGKQGGQEVPHLHIHLIGGRDLQWPPG